MTKFPKLISFLFLTQAILTGCAGSPVPVSEVTKDKKAYLKQQFSPQSIPESVYKKLPLEGDSVAPHEVKIHQNSHVVSSTGKEINRKLVTNYSVLGNGLVQTLMEYSSNDIPNIYSLAITYKGFFNLRWLDVYPSESNSRFPAEIKEVFLFNNLNLTPNDKFTVRYKHGNVIQIAGYTDAEYSCTVGNKFPAGDVHKKLSGDAYKLDCEMAPNGVVAYRERLIYLAPLGFAIRSETTNASYKESLTVEDVTGI